MACGTGKTLIVLEWLKLFPNEKTIIFVPNSLLLHQWANQLPGCIKVGSDYNGHIDLSKNLYVCIYNSAIHLKTIENVDTTIIDEGHHLEGILETKEDDYEQFQMTYRNEILNLTKRRWFLSATLDETEVDFRYDFETAITEKYLSDYDIIIPVFDKDVNIKDGLVSLLNDRLDLRYVLAYCNSTKQGKKFTELLIENDITAAYLDANTNVDERLRIIKKFESGEYRVLVSVYVLSEGIDIPRASTCLFVEPRCSKINITQCIGRVLRLHANKNFAHVILPSNEEEKTLFNFLRVISNADPRIKKSIIKQELGRINFHHVKSEEDHKSKNVDSYYVSLYNRLGEFLSNTNINWDFKYNLLLKYIETYQKFPRDRVIYENINLGVWITTNRSRYSKGKLSIEQITKLEQVQGWKWTHNLTWSQRFDILKSFVDQYKRFPQKSEKEFHKIYAWIIRQKTFKNNGTLVQNQQEKLKSIPGWQWDIDDDKWNKNFELLQKYQSEYKIMPTQNTVYQDVQLGYWANNQRAFQKRDKLTDELKVKLESIPGWKWIMISWDNTYNLLEEFVSEKKRMISFMETYKGKVLGQWVNTQKKKYAYGELDPSKKIKLEKISYWKWDEKKRIKIRPWQEYYKLLCKYVEEYKKIPLIDNKTIYDDVKIGIWISTQRKKYKDGKLTDEQKKLLGDVKYWTWPTIST